MSDFHEMFENWRDGMEGYLHEPNEDPLLREQEQQERDREWEERDHDW